MGLYLGALLFSLAGMLLLDWRHRLFLWRAPRRALLTLAAGVVLMLAADAVGIFCGIFEIGETPYLTGIVLAPELPLEEPLFLLFLCQLTMVLVTGTERVLAWWAGRSGGSTRASDAEAAR